MNELAELLSENNVSISFDLINFKLSDKIRSKICDFIVYVKDKGNPSIYCNFMCYKEDFSEDWISHFLRPAINLIKEMRINI